MADILELPLKPPPETFVDDPKDIEDVNIHDLVLDIESCSKDVNKLHIYHAMSIFLFTLKDLMKLQENEELFRELRTLHLKQNKVSDSQIETILSNHNDATDPKTTPSPPPLKMTKISHDDTSSSLKETTPESLKEQEVIAIEDLIATTDLSKSYQVDFQNIASEIAYYQDAKVTNQNEFVLKSFDLVAPPAVSIEQFLKRIKTYSSAISVSCYIHAAFLIYKVCCIHRIMPLTPYNVHRLILALLRCLTKMLEDIYQKQKSFATVGGVSQKDLSRIEVGFLFLCNFRLVVNEDTLNNYLKTFASLREFVRTRIDNA